MTENQYELEAGNVRLRINAVLKEKGLTWYYARYSWANYAVDLDIPKDIISEALGHKHGSTVTGIYIKYSLDKVDKANRQVIDYLNEKEPCLPSRVCAVCNQQNKSQNFRFKYKNKVHIIADMQHKPPTV